MGIVLAAKASVTSGRLTPPEFYMNNTMARAIALLAIAAVACIAAEPLYEENTDDAFRNALFSEVYESALPELDAAFVETAKPKATQTVNPKAQKAALKKGVKKMSGQMS